MRALTLLVAAGALLGCGASTPTPGAQRPRPGGRRPAVGPGQTKPPPPRSGLASPGAEDAAIKRLIALGRPIYCGARRGNLVALTFDDGPGPYTALALRKLRKHGVRATFFVVGKELVKGPALLRQEVAIGAVGDHTWTHPVLPALSAGAVHDELARTQAAVARAAGAPVRLFRPPYGARTPAIDRQAQALGMVEILWNVDSADSQGANYAGITANVRRGLQGGSIVLMHENRGQTIRALLSILPEVHRRHLRAVSLPELLALDPPSTSQVLAGPKGCSQVGGGKAGSGG